MTLDPPGGTPTLIPMRLLGSRYFSAALLVVATLLSLAVLWVELDRLARWAVCADAMQHSLILCDAGPGGWGVGTTVFVAVLLAGASGVAIERARTARRGE
ncbi:MAG: hypothetical protein HY263_04165 [Chloroflexi bacterium]|nr:hypothetical protein [Chloroflexota bacterium]